MTTTKTLKVTLTRDDYGTYNIETEHGQVCCMGPGRPSDDRIRKASRPYRDEDVVIIDRSA